MRVSNVTVRRRLIFVLIAGVCIFFIIAARLGYVQFVIGGWLTGKALDSWSRNIPFEPQRGEILDRNGVPLATNISAPTVFVIPKQIKDPVQTSKQLASILDVKEQDVYKKITKKSMIIRMDQGGRKISNEKANQVRALNLAGVFIAEDSKRHYPYGSYLSHVLGFAGIDNQGLTGLEQYYDKQLSGKKGHVSFFSDARGKRMPSLSDDYERPSNGNNLKLTIDSKVQTIIERELDIAQAKYNPDGAVAIAMNPSTGEILGMSSRPDFNPEDYRRVSPEVYNRNLPVWANYEPGSTFKIITLASAIEEKKVDLERDHFNDPGSIEVGGRKLRCWRRSGHGSQSFLEGVQNSCNPGFVILGQRLGKEKLFSYIRNFGFGQKTGIDLQGEATGILFNENKVGPLELATTAFGQGVSVTPIQQVAAVSAAVNGGYLYEPYIAKEIDDPVTGKPISIQSPKLKRKVISEETSKQVRHALEMVVAQGTGRNAYVDGYRVGGKTGTAQKAKDGKYLQNNHIVSFIGIAPADDPQLVVYVAIDNPKNTVQFGGTVAAPIVGKMMDDSLRAMGIEKRKNQIEKKKQWPDVDMIEVPNLVGVPVDKLQDMMYELNVKTSGKGEYIVKQAPAPGVKLKPGSVIRLFLGDKPGG
ncbi:stage V sporulation protein [Fictibacillus macauensis ZFHKF-1]|uniref:Stage V sporulation protein n=1 Tax=Fictibacillus macauensis ZFHKF-1 TaxID=1196324 RepID=I8AHU3_9BACL|nr:stage V sporulation protein D [Fictibacillus macauensis]EIT84989.1 stage V sporulation protein [Fictibacillus macauensis ZFHKF-1]